MKLVDEMMKENRLKWRFILIRLFRYSSRLVIIAGKLVGKLMLEITRTLFLIGRA